LFLLIIALGVSACKKGLDLDGIPAPTAPAVRDTLPPSGGPGYPDVDLAADWLPNGFTPGGIDYQKTFSADGMDTLTAEGFFPQTGVEWSAIDAYYRNTREDFTRLAESMAEKAEGELQSHRLEAGFAVEINAGGIFSVSRTLHQYLGGAHGSTEILCETFHVETGEMLRLDDFFNIGAEVYSARMLEYADAVIGRTPDEFFPDAKQTARGLFDWLPFCITPNGVSLFFPEYSIAPGAAGIVRIDVPWGGIAEWFELP
jgi:hypothetical protein